MQETVERSGLPYLDFPGEKEPYIDVLTEDECARVRSVVHEMKKHWARDRLGFAAYKLKPFVDRRIGAIGRLLYYLSAKRLNPMLRTKLGWMYDRIEERLAVALGAPTCYPSDLALPGFHVFVQPIRDKAIHFDGQHRHLNWGRAGAVDLEHPLSFTLAIALPRSGAGLNLWDITQPECRGLSSDQRKQLMRSRHKVFIPYRLGKMVCHSGYGMHQIADSMDFVPGDERITLQGHGIMRNGVWQLYW
jgi:hypothetical protein